MVPVLIYPDTLRDSLKKDPLNQISIKHALMLHSSKK